MGQTRKIATCCYCGTRAVLVLDQSRHELTCSACGAPLHDMKFMPKLVEKSVKKERSMASHRAASAVHVRSPVRKFAQSKRPKKSKRRNPIFRKIVEELWDEIEDIFD